MTTKTNVVPTLNPIAAGLANAFIEGQGAGVLVDAAHANLQDKQKQFTAKAKELRKALAGKKIGKAGYEKGGFKSRQTRDTSRSCSVANTLAQTLFDAKKADGSALYTADTVQTYLKILRSVINDNKKFSFNASRDSKKKTTSGTKTLYLDIRLKADLNAEEASQKLIESINKFKKEADADTNSEVLKVAAFMLDAVTPKTEK